MGRQRFELRSPDPKALTIDYNSLKPEFEQWLKSRIDIKTAQCYISYLDRYVSNTVIESVDDLVEICLTVTAGWNWWAKAVRNLINYCVERRLIDKGLAVELKEVLKLKKTGFDTYVPSDESVRAVLEQCDRDDYRLVMKIVYYSGVRVTEALKMLAEFDSKRLHFVDGVGYYDLDWERGKKKSFKIFMPAEIAKQLRKTNISESGVYSYFQDLGLPLKYGRNFFIDKMVKAGVQESLIKFMVGHSNGSVLMTNYLEKLNNSIHAYRKALPTLQSILE